ncbi:MAG TPA: BatD family protein [Xanthomonadaceae bacterium]|jgi:hypothetical protein
MKRWWIVSAVLLLCFAASADAAVRASLDRDHVALGDAVNLTIESDGSSSSGKPDLSALQKDFDVRGVSTGSQTTIVNGSMHSSVQWSVGLVPRRSGMIDIPALDFGGQRTSPLRVLVDPARTSGANAGTNPSGDMQPSTHGSGSVFLDSAIAPEHPYVGQAAIYTVRLYYAATLLEASLEVPNTDNGDLRQVGEDERGSAVVQGRRYDVLERHYLLQPEHSGSLHVPAPVFQGRAMPDLSGGFDDELGGTGLRAIGKAIDEQVRPRPAQASDPWLPAQSVTLSIDPPASTPHAGEPFSVVVHESGEGVTASQLPEITLPAIAGAQVYPEPSSTEEHARDGSLRAERTRRFAIVVDHAGPLHLPDLTVPWWDLANDHAALARASLPDVQVQPGATVQNANGGNASTSGDAATQPVASPAGALRAWQVATLALAVLLVLTFAWGWRRGQVGEGDGSTDDDASMGPLPQDRQALPRALAAGDPAAIAQALCDAAPAPRPHHLHEVARRLADPAQRDALQAFDAARWRGDGQPPEQVLARLREAFARAPRWAAPVKSTTAAGVLPPLYPD